MKKLLSEIITAWWSEVDTKLVNPKSDEAIKGLKLVLREDFEFDSDVIDYVVEMIRSTPTNFDLGGKTSGIDVGKNQTAVSAQLHPNWDDDEEEDDEDDVYNNNDGELSEWDVTLLDGLDELNEDTWVKHKQSGNVYQVKNPNPEIHTEPSPDEISNAEKSGETKPKDGDEEESGEEETQQQQPDSGKPEFSDSDKVDMMTQLEKDKKKEKQAAKKVKKQSDDTSPEKNKTLKDIDSVNEFNTNPKFAEDGVSDADFKSNENIVPTSQQFEFDGNYYFGEPKKFPKKYEKVLKRLLNTKKSKDISITDFTDAAGGGTLSSTAGEILTTLVLAIDDDEKANEFLDKVAKHVKETKNESIFDAGWIKSARQVRNATKRRYDRMFGEGNWELETMAWDIQDEVESLGLEDYKKNKGFSTDTYAKLKVNGESKLDEISLKKSKAANLLNTTTNRVDDIFFKGSAPQEELDEMESLEVEYNTISSKKDKVSVQRKKEILNRITELYGKYNNQIPEDARVEVTKEKQAKIHAEGLEKNGQSIQEGYQKYSELSKEEKDSSFRELELMMGQNFSSKQRKQFEDAFSQITPPFTIGKLKDINKSVGLGTDSRKVQKTSVMIHGMCKILGNSAGETYDKLVDNSHKHASAVAKSILENENARKGLLNSIREDFPLKSLMAGEENMTLGNLSADKQTLSEVFGVSNFDELQENLKVRETPPPPSIVYSVDGDEPIPVSIINTRPDGIGYGGTWKLEMKVHPEFASKIEEAQSKLEN